MYAKHSFTIYCSWGNHIYVPLRPFLGLWSQSHTAQHTREEYGRKRVAKLETADIVSAPPSLSPGATPSPGTAVARPAAESTARSASVDTAIAATAIRELRQHTAMEES